MPNRSLMLGMLAATTCLAGCQPVEPELPSCVGALADHGATLDSDREHCGACDKACAIGDVCLGGKCGADPLWALWPIPELPFSEEQYLIRTDVVRDRVTGLEWQRLVSPERVAFDQADEHCRALELAGGDWRLPTRIELLSIIDFTRAMPAIDTTVFPDTPNGPFKYALSGTSGRAPERPVDYLDLATGTGSAYRTETDEAGLEQHVRCVRQVAEPKPMDEHYAASPGTVLDRWTGLRWARVASAPCKECWRSGPINSLSDAERYCDEIVVDGYDDFRVPTLVELFSIFDPRADACCNVRVDADAFPGEREQFDSEFFSSTRDADDRPWVLDFRLGEAGTSIGARRVRCVRTESR